MENLLDPLAQEFYPQLPPPIPQIYYPTPPPTYYAPPPQVNTDAAASRAVVLNTVPRHVTEPSLIQSMAVFGGVRSIDTGFLLANGSVTVHFYDLRSAQIAVAEICEQHVRQQSRLGQQYLYGCGLPPPPENLAAAPLPFSRGLIDGQAVWAQFAAENLDVLNQGSLFVTVSDPAISSENVRDIFQNYGPIKEVRESPTKPRRKIVEFFDVRDAARALNELNAKEFGLRRFSVEFYRAGHDQFSRSYRQYQKRSGQQNLLPPRLARNQAGERGAAVLKRNDAKISNVSKSGKDSNDGGKRNKGSRSSGSYPSSSSAAPSSSKQQQQQQQQLSKKEWKRNKNYSNRRDIDASRFQFKEGDYESGSSSSAASSCRDSRTTVMIKNIPNKYSQKLLLNMLDSHCIHCNEQIGDGDDEPLSAYDFVYLPIDFNNKCNVGYGFVNLTSPEATVRLYKAFRLQPWEVFNSRKICEVTYARLQGLEALKEHFKISKFACNVDEYLPAVFEPPRDGRQLTEPMPIGGQGSWQAHPLFGVKIRAGPDRGDEEEAGDGGSIDETCGRISTLELLSSSSSSSSSSSCQTKERIDW